MLDAISSNGMKEAGYEYVNIDEYAALPPTPGHSSPRIGRTLSAAHLARMANGTAHGMAHGTEQTRRADRGGAEVF